MKRHSSNQQQLLVTLSPISVQQDRWVAKGRRGGVDMRSLVIRDASIGALHCESAGSWGMAGGCMQEKYIGLVSDAKDSAVLVYF